MVIEFTAAASSASGASPRACEKLNPSIFQEIHKNLNDMLVRGFDENRCHPNTDEIGLKPCEVRTAAAKI